VLLKLDVPDIQDPTGECSPSSRISVPRRCSAQSEYVLALMCPDAVGPTVGVMSIDFEARSGKQGSAKTNSSLAFHDLTKRFGVTLAVDRLTATVRPGVVTAFLGRNGAGKTTTLRMLLGLVAPSSGTATIDGRGYDELADPIHEVGSMLEATGFHPTRSARNHLRTIQTAAGLPADAPGRVLEIVGLAGVADRKVGQYSLGMRQRLGLAAAMLGDPAVLVLDEPANGLDPQGIRWLRDLLRGFAGEGRTVLVSSHLLAEVEQFADDVLVLEGGRLVRQARLSELLAQHAGQSLVRSPEVRRLASALAEAGHTSTVAPSGELVVQTAAPLVGDVAAVHGIALHHLTSIGLEDVFISITEGVEP
jgi:ABC-2 type transport system ATP-binding protein